jgi:hypothetical protein
MNSPYSLETLAKIAIWRQKCIDGTITIEEMREAVAVMRGDRKAAAQAAAASSKRTAKPKAQVQSADEMLDELGKI